MTDFKIHVSSSPSSSFFFSSITASTVDQGSRSCDTGTHKRKYRQQETNNNSSLLNLSSYPNETNVCLHLSLYFCNCIEIAKKQKLAHQDTNVDAVVPVGTSSDPWKIKKVLTLSDVGYNSRLLLKKELAKEWIVPFLNKAEAEKDGVKVAVFDVDTQSLRSLVFKIWPSNGSHVFIDTWIFCMQKEFTGWR
ncbi:unnamed protein product [Lathyrus sativus]|nr:unnamed protein product [Lathyrus sativus]